MNALSPAKKAQLAALLAQQKQGLVGRIRDELVASGNQHLADLAGRVHDAGDESVASLLADVDAARMDHDVQELRAIEATLARLETPEFGACEDCGQAIAFARLEAYPTATRCVTCQTRHEARYAHAGTPRL